VSWNALFELIKRGGSRYKKRSSLSSHASRV
jgi:hypothetical protein